MPKTIVSTHWLRNLTLALGLLILSGLSYGLLANKMGFFLDDWYIVSTYRVFGVSGFIEYFRGDRPLLSYVYLIFMPLLRDSPLAWQIFAIFSKWLSAILFWILLEMLLPNKKLFNYATAMLFGIYPGFKFHYFVIMYSQTYFLMALYFTSYILMLLSFKPGRQRWVFTTLALVCQFIGIAPMEYFYGLELIRPILIFLVLPQLGLKFGKRALTALKFWLPYALVFLSFTAFRVLSSSQYAYQINLLNSLPSTPFRNLLTLGSTLLKGLWDSCVKVWASFAPILEATTDFRGVYLRIGLMLLAFSLALLLFFFLRHKQANSEPRTSTELLVLGIICILAAMVPFVVAGFEVNLDFPTNRFMLPLSIGACIFIVALIDQLFRTQTQKMIVLALLVGFSVGTNYLVARDYKEAWENQQNFFAQMTWRMPQIAPKTTLTTSVLPFDKYFSGASLSAPLNLIYAPENQSNPIPYQLVQAASDERPLLPDLIPDQTIQSGFRAFTFEGNTSDVIVFNMPAQGCLQIVNPKLDPEAFSDNKHAALWKELIPLSNLSRIQVAAPQVELPDQYFSPQETETWCYYYEKAELANQIGDWKTTTSLFLAAESAGLRPLNAYEYAPFILAFNELGLFETALNITSANEIDSRMTRATFCSLWSDQVPKLSAGPIKDRAANLLKSWYCEVSNYE